MFGEKLTLCKVEFPVADADDVGVRSIGSAFYCQYARTSAPRPDPPTHGRWQANRVMAWHGAGGHICSSTTPSWPCLSFERRICQALEV